MLNMTYVILLLERYSIVDACFAVFRNFFKGWQD